MTRACPLALALAALLAPSAARAEGNDDSVTIGAGVAYGPSYEGSDDYRAIPAAQLRGKLSGHNFYTRGLSLFVDAIPEQPGETLDLALGPVIGIRRDRVSGIGDDRVRALGKLDTAVEIGGFVGIAKTGVVTSAYDTLSFRLSYVRDVAGAHGSHVVTPAIEYGTPLSARAYVGLSVSADYVGDGYARYYYGVTPAGAAASGLVAFDADGGFKNLSFGLLGARSLTGDLRHGWSLVAYGSYAKLLGRFKRSPLVSDAGDSDQWFGALGLGYTF